MNALKRLGSVLAIVLAMNFLAVIGLVGWLYSGGRLTGENVTAIKDVLFPKPPAPVPTSQPATEDAPVDDPLKQLRLLLEQQSGKSAAEQVEQIRATFDTQVAELDRRRRELYDLQRQINLAKQQMADDRQQLDKREVAVAARETAADKVSTDEGFQQTLALYNALPAEQVKQLFLGMDEAMAVQYLRAMEPRVASKILKTFETPQEVAQAQRLLEGLRTGSESAIPPDARANAAN